MRQDHSTSAAISSASITPSPRGPTRLTWLSKLTGGDFFDIVIDATGKASAMMAGFDYVAHGGTYVLVSVVLDTISFADPKFHAREISLLGSRNATREDFVEVFSAMREGLVPTDALATHRASLEQSPARFPEWIRPETGVIKALIEICRMAFPIIQFGTSRFLQAHVDLFVSEALERRRHRTYRRGSDDAERGKPQTDRGFAEGRPYVVQIKGIASGPWWTEVEVSSVGGGVDANENWAEVERLFNEARCMVSNTADRGYETYASDAPDGERPAPFRKAGEAAPRPHRAGARRSRSFPAS